MREKRGSEDYVEITKKEKTKKKSRENKECKNEEGDVELRR